MRKKLLIISTIIISILSFAQVGVNIASPATTLDVTAKNETGTSTNVDGILIPRVDRQRAQSMTGVQTSTLIYVNSIATGTTTGTTVNVDAVGYYFFNGTRWIKLNPIDTTNNVFIPKVVASASFGSVVLVQSGTPAFVAPTTVANANDGNYDLNTNKYTVATAGTYNLSITAGFQLVNNSGNNGFTLIAIRENSSGTQIDNIRLGTSSNLSWPGGGVAPGVSSYAGSAVVRANVGDKLYFLLQVCNGCGGGRYDLYQVEVTYQQISN